MEYQVDVESITPAELEADSRWIRAVKAHSATAAHQPIDATFLDPDAEDFSTAEHHPYLANINYAAARTTDRVRINPCNNSLAVSTPYEPRARLYLHASELRLGTISYPLRAYMAATDNALRDIIYNAIDSHTQDEIIQNLQSMNLNTPYAFADARRMGRSKSILITIVGTTILLSSIA
ncbi:hypothetical protein HPB51_020734 [Rhipicephalus microplus]|uniref:Uncharacterized protein n=1 Tax=Rhipicephalus microplus TaxID=6941 RepID=A0A9J6EB23_RHIMP|nr:hypothetical protein HPB51_020734 [Rhipicephalus microplus]